MCTSVDELTAGVSVREAILQQLYRTLELSKSSNFWKFCGIFGRLRQISVICPREVKRSCSGGDVLSWSCTSCVAVVAADSAVLT